MSQDRSTAAEFESLVHAADASFAELAREHDHLIETAVTHYSENAKSTNASEVVKGEHASRHAAIIKAIMAFRFPEATAAWFNE